MTVYSPSLTLKARNSLSLSQRKFANVIGVHYTTIANWELGKKEPSKMAKTLLQAIIDNPELFNSSHLQLPMPSST